MSGEAPQAEHTFSRRQLGALFYHVRDTVALLDASWRIRRWNPAGERLFGYAEDRLAGQPFSSLFADAEEFARTRAALTDQSPSAHATLRSQIGRLIPVNCRTIPVDAPGGGGEVYAVLIQEEPSDVVDATGRALIRQLHELAETTAAILAEPDMRRIAQSLTDLAKVLVGADFSALVLVRPDGDGYTPTDFSYNAPRDLFPMDKAHPDVVGLLAKPMLSRSIVRVADIRGYPGSVGIPVHHPPVAAFLGVPLFSKGAVIGELLAANRVGRPAFTDLEEALLAQLGTIAGALLENARLQGEVAEHVRSVDQLNARRRSAMAAIAHDLRTPAAAVRGYAELAADPQLPGAKRTMVLERLEKQAQQLNRLIDDLSTAARLDTEKLTVELGPVELTELLEEAKADYLLRYADRIFDIVGLPAPRVTADRQRLRQVLTNVLDNAIKYSPAASPVRIEVAADPRQAFITVVDLGRGIPADEVPRVFEPFYRSKSAEEIAGMGLGLTIVRGLMQAMGGEVTVESTGSAGSRFRLCLRRADV
ncbi:MAG TPA: ATP-binding protein [Candidatus Dormibacteraeota bacterium]